MASDTYGAILLTTANDVGAMIQKKMATPSETYAPAVWAETINLLGKLPEATVSGSIVTFSDGADEVPIKKCEITLPASLDGYSSVDVVGCGKNLMNQTFEIGSVSESTPVGSTYAQLKIASTKRGRTKELVPIPKAGRYTFSCASPYKLFLCYFDQDQRYLRTYRGWSGVQTFYVDFSNTDKYVGIAFKIDEATDITSDDFDAIHLQIEYSDTASTFEPYSGTTYTVNLGRTIYGGTVDIVNGTGTDENNKFAVTPDMSDSILYIGSGNTAYIQINKTPASNGRWQDLACSHFTPANIYAGGTQQGIGCYSAQFYIRDSRFTSKQDFLDFLTEQETLGTPLEICYKLATPTDFTFDGQEINTRLGYNAFWSDSGDTEVTYRRDIDLALQSLSGSRGLMMARPQAAAETEETEPEDETTETIEETPEDMEK